MQRPPLTSRASEASGPVDERYQLERWGEDAELAARCARVARDAADAERLFRLMLAA